jgi:hypothetical protein
MQVEFVTQTLCLRGYAVRVSPRLHAAQEPTRETKPVVAAMARTPVFAAEQAKIHAEIAAREKAGLAGPDRDRS